MNQVELWSHGAFVAVVEVLPFAAPPTVVTWGNRLFVIALEQGGRADRWRYSEAVAVASLTPSPGLPR